MKSYNNNKSYKVKPQSEEDYFSSTFNNPRNKTKKTPEIIFPTQKMIIKKTATLILTMNMDKAIPRGIIQNQNTEKATITKKKILKLTQAQVDFYLQILYQALLIKMTMKSLML
jgi:hypothetical protein